jgi:hypothetical protein
MRAFFTRFWLAGVNPPLISVWKFVLQPHLCVLRQLCGQNINEPD